MRTRTIHLGNKIEFMGSRGKCRLWVFKKVASERSGARGRCPDLPVKRSKGTATKLLLLSVLLQAA